MANINDFDKRVLETLTGSDKIKALLSGRGLTLKDFAEKHNEWVHNVSRCIRGERPLPNIRSKLSSELDVSRERIDELIDGGEGNG